MNTPTQRQTYLVSGTKASSRLAWNTIHTMTGQGARLVIQAAYFILMARNLGSHQYGAFVAVTAAAAIVSPFVGNGTGILIVKHVARDRSAFAECWGNALFMNVVSGVLFAIGVAIACLAFLPHSIPPVVIVQVVAAEVVMGKLVEVAGYAFQAVEQLGWTAAINVFATFLRLIGIIAIVFLRRPTLLAWSTAYLLSLAIGAAAGVSCVFWRIGKPRLALSRVVEDLREGFYYSTGLSAQTIYNDIDKTMLARLGSFGATGIYAAAYRLIDISFIPVKALLAAAFPGFFRNGHRGIVGSLSYARRLMPRALLYSVVVATALLIGAPLVPMVLGPSYASTSEALRWLALLPLLKTAHYFVADSLTGAGHQGLRTLIQVVVAAFNVGINLWIIPVYSWRGAAWSSLASDALLAACLWGCAAVLRARSQAFRRPAEIAAEIC